MADQPDYFAALARRALAAWDADVTANRGIVETLLAEANQPAAGASATAPGGKPSRAVLQESLARALALPIELDSLPIQKRIEMIAGNGRAVD